MAYLRKPEDQKRGTPKGLTQPLSSPSTSKSKMPSIPNVPALVPIGEDEASMKRHFKMMQNEFKKVVPNKKIVIDLMRRTFPLRQQDVLNETATISFILEKYPALADSDEVNIHYCLLMCMHNVIYLFLR